MPEVSFLRDARNIEIKFYLDYSKMLSSVNDIDTKIFLYQILRYTKCIQRHTKCNTT